MDGSETPVKLKENDVITPGCLRRVSSMSSRVMNVLFLGALVQPLIIIISYYFRKVRGKGMPNEGNPEQTGDLYLRSVGLSQRIELFTTSCHYTHHCPLLYRTLCYATPNLILYIITFHHRFEVVFPTPKEVDELGENWRDEIRTLLGYEGSGDQLLGRAAASIDSKLGHGGRKNRCA